MQHMVGMHRAPVSRHCALELLKTTEESWSLSTTEKSVAARGTLSSASMKSQSTGATNGSRLIA